MKKLSMFASILVVALAVVLPLQAGDTDEVKLTGWITDEWCGANNANAGGGECAKACAEKGAQVVLFSEGKLYKLSDRELALKHVGYEVLVTGTVSEDMITVSSIEKAAEEKA